MGELSLASTKELNLNNAKIEKIEEGVVGINKCSIIVIFQTCVFPTVDRAVDNALEKSRGDLLKNVKLERSWWYIPYIYGQIKTKVTGDAYRVSGDKENSPN
jgi:hypothetical protein